MTDKGRGKIALVLKGYPRLSETFIAQEILELERAGFEISLISLRHPTDKHTHPIHDEIIAEKCYLPEYVLDEPMRILRAKLHCLFKPGYWKVTPVFLKDLFRDPTPNRVRRFAQAMVLAKEYAPNCDMIYAHFLHTPGSVARYASIISGKKFAISAHAKDIWTIPEWEKREKLNDCEWLATCTRSGAENKDGSSKAKAIKLVTVGRAVAKKGIDTLLHALSALPENLHWRWTHIGGGPLRDELMELSQELGIEQRCEFLGALPQSDVLAAYREADLFVLPSRIDATGDRDGLPNVIMEAQSQGLPVISTNISGIPELINDGFNGVLVEPDDQGGLTRAIEALFQNPENRNRMGMAGENKVREEFSHKQNIGALVKLLSDTLERSHK